MGTLRSDLDIELELDVRTAYDFVLSIRASSAMDDELLPDDRRWIEEARAGIGSLMTDPMFFGEHGLACELAELFVGRPEVRAAADVVALLDGMSDREIVAGLLSDLIEHEEVGSLLARVVDGDQAALPEFEARWAEIKPDHPLGEFLRDREARLATLRSAVRAWLRPYQAIEPRLERMLNRDADARRVDMRTLPAAEAIERATGGLRWLPEAQTRRAILAPSYFGRPYNYLFGAESWRLIVYPLGDDALGEVDRFAPPQAAIRLYRALGDDTRLRILRLLVDRDLYLTELAQQLELSKPTVKHHLTQLRTAGLVTITEEGGLTYYSLRRNRVLEAGPELARFLGI